MTRALIIVTFFALAATIVSAQEKKPQNQEVDSLTMDLEAEGVMVIDTLVTKKKRINPLAPSKAAFYSAVLPGLGQIYNKRYWKVPIVYAAIGTGIYAYTFNDGRYDRFRAAFKRRRAGFTDDEFYDLDGSGIEPGNPDFSDDALEDAQERFQRDRDLALLITILLYALNVVDANVDAHLKQYNIDDDLSFDLDIQPYIDLNPITTDPNYGLALTIKF